jgi:hypothetical protein
VVTLVATAVEDPTKSGQGTEILTTSTGDLLCDAGSGKESLLKGQYAFLFQAFGSLAWGGMGIAGSVTANGSGKITGGEEDIILDSGASEVSPIISTTASLYAVGADHRGCLMLADTNGATTFLRFVLGSVNASGIATAAHIIQFGGSNGAATRAAGSFRLQDPTSFAADKFKGKYAFGTVRRTPTIPGTAVIGSLAIAGTFESDGVSAIPSANMDMNLGGVITSDVSSVGNFQCCDAHGRGTGGFSDTNPAIGFVFYQINSADAFFMLNNDGLGAQGEAIGISSGTIFSQSSLHGSAVLRQTAQSPSGPAVNLALASANGIDAITMSEYLNDAGIFSISKAAMTYRVAPNGRVTFEGSSSPPVFYLHGPNQGFWLGTDANVTFGILEPQAGGPFNDGSFSGAYMFGTEYPSASTVTLESGVVTAEGNGQATGTSDLSSPSAWTQSQSLNFSYSFSADGIGNVGSGTTAILISPSKLAFINNSSANPAITVVEK